MTASNSESERADFETWAVTILGDSPTWKGSGDCELAWQSWQAARARQSAEVGVLRFALQQIVDADDTHALTQQHIEIGRAAITRKAEDGHE